MVSSINNSKYKYMNTNSEFTVIMRDVCYTTFSICIKDQNLNLATMSLRPTKSGVALQG